VYWLVSRNKPPRDHIVIKSHLKRIGDRYASQPGGLSGADAETEFRLIRAVENGFLIAAYPRTGRTHQIRVHASENGFPIVGDALYSGASYRRLCLHAAALEFRNPGSGVIQRFETEPDFKKAPNLVLRLAIVHGGDTTAFRWQHKGETAEADIMKDQIGQYGLIQSPGALPAKYGRITELPSKYGLKGIYHKRITTRVREISKEEARATLVAGEPAKGPFIALENGVKFEMSFQEGYSTGLFLDQRDNRRRLLRNYVGADFPLKLEGAEVLNTFAYTCAFSVCAGLAGASVTSLDLSRKYLDWGRRNFQLNELDPAHHDFIYGDVFDWLKRFAKKGRQFDLVLLDPPTFSQSKDSGVFRAETDFAKLAGDALRVLKPGGVLFASTNAARLKPEDFLAQIHNSVSAARRKILAEHYCPQPPDFPISKG
jgi:23S rRNA (cytosine1962-C5)-methyltransferase